MVGSCEWICLAIDPVDEDDRVVGFGQGAGSDGRQQNSKQHPHPASNKCGLHAFSLLRNIGPAELKGRVLNAPHSRHREAPITRERQAAPDWARARSVS